MTCEDCEAETVPQKRWQAMSIEERRHSGLKRRCGKYCAACSGRRSRRTERQRWKLEDLVAETELLLSDGLAGKQVASRLGIKHASLIQAFQRARAKGLTTRRIDYRGTSELH